MYCRHCGTKLKVGSCRCPSCKRIGTDGKKYCPHCGAALEFLETEKCPHCGRSIDDQVSPRKFRPKSRIYAGVLQILLGWFGAGRFYLGYYGIAILQILVSMLTLGLGGLWPFIDGILILKGHVKTDYEGTPLTDEV